MGRVLQRKDKTSIFCPQSSVSQNVSRIRVKSAELFIALALITIGAWIIISIH